MVRAGLEPGISGSQGKRFNHWAALPPQNGTVAENNLVGHSCDSKEAVEKLKEKK